MIAYLRGSIYDLTPASVVIECAGVGYFANISLNTYTALNGKSEVKLLVTEIIREDAHILYGFATPQERDLFELLMSVSGVGPSIARVILSTYSPSELNTILALGQVEPLKAVKGIGLKTAQRIVLELKGKLQIEEDGAGSSPAMSPTGTVNTQTQDEATSALEMLGYPKATALKVVRQILTDRPMLSVEEVIKLAFRML